MLFFLAKKKKKFFLLELKVSVKIRFILEVDLVLGAANAKVLLKYISRSFFTPVNWCTKPMKYMNGEAENTTF